MSLSRLLLSFGVRVASPKQIFQPVWETGSLITAVSVGREYGLGAGMGLRTGTHACTHAHAPHKAHAHAHTPHTGTHASTHIQTHTQSPHTGFQLPDSTTERVQILAFRALMHSARSSVCGRSRLSEAQKEGGEAVGGDRAT